MGQLLLVRHGQASFGADDYDVLSETGWEQARVLGTHLAKAGLTPTGMVRGGMRRHRETAEGILEGAGWPSEALVDEAWDEFDHVGVMSAYGEPVEPGDRRGFQRVFELAVSAWVEGSLTGDHESHADFVARVRGALGRAVEQAGSGQTHVVVTSGGPIAIAAASLLVPDPDDADVMAAVMQRLNAVIVNTGVSRVVVGGEGGARLLTLNEHAHVAGDLLTYR